MSQLPELKKFSFAVNCRELPASAALPAGNLTVVVRPSWFVSVALE